MNRELVAQAVAEAGHAAHLPTIDAALQPAIHLTATALAGRPGHWRRPGIEEEVDEEAIAAYDAALDALPLGASRLGGLPDLPPGATWPARDGVPMEFIAQLRLAELAPLDPLGRLPAQGSLLFFYNSQWGTTDLAGDGCCAVLFHDGPDAALVRATPPHVEWKSEFSDVPQVAPFLHGLAALAGTPYLALPGGVGPFVPAGMEDHWQDFHADRSTSLAPPGAQNHLLGYVDEQDYVDAHAGGTDDQLLLQIDSDDEAQLNFGDCNKLFFLLRKDELAARDFSRVRVYSMLG